MRPTVRHPHDSPPDGIATRPTPFPHGPNFTVTIPRVDGQFTGVGDILAFLFVAWVLKGDSCEAAVNKACTTTVQLLRNSVGKYNVDLIGTFSTITQSEQEFVIEPFSP